MGRTAEAADANVLLASEQDRWLTGLLVYVDGGWRKHQQINFNGQMQSADQLLI